jgi:hypothetical protein
MTELPRIGPYELRVSLVPHGSSMFIQRQDEGRKRTVAFVDTLAEWDRFAAAIAAGSDEVAAVHAIDVKAATGRRPVTVFIPAHADHTLLSLVAAASGIVASEAADAERLEIDFQQPSPAANITNYADRVHHAWGRWATRYPTTQRATVAVATLRRIGIYDPIEGVIVVDDEAVDPLCQWLAQPRPLTVEELAAQLLASGIRFEQRRAIRRALATELDPGRRHAIRQLARRQGHSDLADDPTPNP